MRAVAAALAIAFVAAVPLPPSAPGCIAAITVVPTGTVLSGQTVTFTDGTIVNPQTRFVSRSWNFGDGARATSTQADALAVTHVYVNGTGRTRVYDVSLTEHTGLSACTTSFSFNVSPSSL